MSSNCIIALGSNSTFADNSPELLVKTALTKIKSAVFQTALTSRLFQTEAIPKGSGPDFVNAVVVGRTVLSPEAVLARCHQIEAQAGRVRTKRWGARTLDLDLIAHGAAVRPSLAAQAAWRRLPEARQLQVAPRQLILPHPRMQDRAFVLAPLAEVAPDWRHPILGLTVRQMLAHLERRGALTGVKGEDASPVNRPKGPA